MISREFHLRSILKMVSWRVLITISNFIGAWWASGDWKVGIGAAGFAFVVNNLLYWYHERIWAHVKTGYK